MQTYTFIIDIIIHKILEVKALRIAWFIKVSKYQNEVLRQKKMYMITPIVYC